MTRADAVLTRAQDTLLSGPESVLLMVAGIALVCLGVAWLIAPGPEEEELADVPDVRQPRSLADCIDRRPGRR